MCIVFLAYQVSGKIGSSEVPGGTKSVIWQLDDRLSVLIGSDAVVRRLNVYEADKLYMTLADLALNYVYLSRGHRCSE